MIIKLKDKRKALQLGLAVLVVAIIFIIALPHILNGVFGNSISDEVVTVTTDVASEFDVGFIDGNFSVYNSQGLKQYNTNGEYEREYYLSAYTPIMHTKGKYTVLGDTSSTDVTVLKGNSVLYELKVPENIKNISINKKGYTTVLTGETGYKSLVTVYDNSGTEKYRWYSDESYVIDAKLTDDSKMLVIAAVKMEGNKLNSVVEFYKLNSENVISRTAVEDIVPYSIVPKGSGAVLIGDEKAYNITKSGKVKTEYDYKGKILECFDDDGNNIVLALSEDGGATDIVTLDSNLKEKGVNKCDFLVSMIDENKGKIAAVGEGKIKISNVNGKTLIEDELSKDGKYVVLADNWRKFAIYSASSINIYKIRRGR